MAKKIENLRNVPARQQIATATKINAIRKANGNPGAQCPTCTRSAASPYRFKAHDGSTGGCVDAFHTGHTCAGESTRHHFSAFAAKCRRDELAWLEAL